MAEREAIYKLKFLVDKSGQQESSRSIDALADSFADLDKNAQQVSHSAQNAVDKLIAFNRGRNELQATSDEAKQLAINADDAKTALEHAADVSSDMRKVADEARNAREELQKTANAADDLGSRLDQADERFDVVSRRVGSAGDVQSNLGAIRGLSQVAGIGGAGQAVGTAGEIAALVEELPRLKAAAQNLPDVLKFAASEIGASGVGLIGALAALGVAFSLLAKEARGNREDVSELIHDQREYNEFIVSATQESIDERIAELQRQNEAEQRTLEQARETRDKFNKALDEEFGESGAKALKTIDNLTGAFGSIDEINNQVEASKDKIKGTQAEIDRLTQAYSDQTIAARSLAQATVDFYQGQYDLQVKYHDLVASGNKEQLDKELENIKFLQDANRDRQRAYFNDIELLKSQGKEVPQTLQDAFDNTLAVTNELSAAQVYLTDTAAPLIEAREREASATEAVTAAQSALTSALGHQEAVTKERITQIKEQAQNELEYTRFLKTATADQIASRIESLQEEAAMLQTLLPQLKSVPEEYQNAADRLAEINAELEKLGTGGVIAAIAHEQEQLTDDIAKIEAARNEKIAQIREQAAQKEIELYESLQEDLADATADANDKRIDAQREYEESAADIARDLARKRLDIEKKYSRDAANAIGDRDALALYQAKQTRDDQLEDADDAAQQAQEELQRNYAQQLETINRELDKQRQTLQAKYNQQLQDLQQQTNNSINAERQKAQQEIAARQQAYQQELALLNGFAAQGTSSINAFATNSLTTLNAFVTQAQSIMAGLMGSAGGVIAGTGASTPIPPITNRPPGAPGGPQPAPTIGITINGHTIEAVQAELYGVLKNIMPY